MSRKKHNTPSRTLRRFWSKGWDYPSGAKALGVHTSHLHRVLIGERESRSLLCRVEELPAREEVAP